MFSAFRFMIESSASVRSASILCTSVSIIANADAAAPPPATGSQKYATRQRVGSVPSLEPPRRRTLEREFFLHDGRDATGHFVGMFFGAGLDHHADDRFGAGLPQQHAAVFAELRGLFFDGDPH